MIDPVIVAAGALGLAALIIYVTRAQVRDRYEPCNEDPTVRIRRSAVGYDFECVGCGRVVRCLTDDRAWAITSVGARGCCEAAS